MKGDVSTLPRWAQVLITKLEADVQYYRGMLTQMDRPNSPVYWEDVEDRHGLPERATVTFTTPHGGIDVEMRDGAVLVYGFSKRLVVMPEHSNSIKLVLQPFWPREIK